MFTTQINVFMEDKAGRLAQITQILGDNNINIRGFCVSDSAEGYGILRLITADPEVTSALLQKSGFSVSLNKVICVDVPDKPGGLASVLRVFSQNGINVEYMYSIVFNKIVFSVSNPTLAIKTLEENKIKVLSENEVHLL